MSDDIRSATGRDATELTLSVAGVEIVLVRISPGRFTIGSPANEAGRLDNEGPQRSVTISKAFYIGRFPITIAQFQNVMSGGAAGESEAPVSEIFYADAKEFVRRVSTLAQFEVKLPTEAQWEYACRAGTQTPYYSGATEADLARAGWYSGNSEGHAHPVGLKEPNAWGLYDLHGNVWEYCEDFIDDYATISNVDPVGRITDRHGAMRGGGWMHGPSHCRAATRLISDDMFGGAGFRVALMPGEA
jgi:formylglycine-generating enzyme required for sulfatase activity